jgi:Zn-dependent protease
VHRLRGRRERPALSNLRRLTQPGALVALGLTLVALYSIRHTISSTTLLVIALVIPSIILHEVAHGVAAWSFGDDTARRAGRLTLNPVSHVDPVGTLVLPGLLALSGLGVFGYAKPVPINPSRMRHPRNDSVIVSLAGPATNLVLAALAVVILRFFRPAATRLDLHFALTYFGLNSLDLTDRALFLFGFVNVTLAVFNALPIPPLDGSAIVVRLLPARALPAWYSMARYSMPVLLLLVLLGRGTFLNHIFAPAERAFAGLVT